MFRTHCLSTGLVQRVYEALRYTTALAEGQFEEKGIEILVSPLEGPDGE